MGSRPRARSSRHSMTMEADLKQALNTAGCGASRSEVIVASARSGPACSRDYRRSQDMRFKRSKPHSRDQAGRMRDLLPRHRQIRPDGRYCVPQMQARLSQRIAADRQAATDKVTDSARRRRQELQDAITIDADQAAIGLQAWKRRSSAWRGAAGAENGLAQVRRAGEDDGKQGAGTPGTQLSDRR